jgi:hypothetical protein
MEKRLEYNIEKLIEKMTCHDVYLIEMCRHINSGTKGNTLFSLRGSNSFSYGSYSVYDIATGNLSRCCTTIQHISLTLKKNRIHSRLYNSTDPFYPISVVIWPNMSDEMIKSIEYIEKGYISRTVHGSDGI